MNRMKCALAACFALGLMVPAPLLADDAGSRKEKPKPELVGNWEIYRTKEPGKPYRRGYKGRPFVSRGPNAFTLVLQYRGDGTFRRISRLGPEEKVRKGKWRLSGHELRQKPIGSRDEEVLYVRFDSPNQYTSIEVYEDTEDPGLFAQFKRVR